MKIISIIPARGGSKGIPNKNIIPIAGKPLLAWTIEQSIASNSIDDTYVSTNDDKIAEVAHQYGAKLIPRPEEISGDTDSSESALLHALNYLKKNEGLTPDIVVFLQCTSPLRKRDDINNAINLFIKESADSSISGSQFADFLFWENIDGKWKSINYDYMNRGRRQDRTPQFVENGSIYIFKPEVLRKNNNRIGGNMILYEMDFWQAWQIDAPEDIPLIEFYINEKLKQIEYFDIKIEEIDLIALDFDGVMTDNKVLTFQDGSEAVFANRSDGLAISKLKELNIPLVVISTEKNKVVASRSEKLNLECIQGVDDKRESLIGYCKKNGFDLNKVLYIGNDINDLEIMKSVGWPICPADAHETIKNISKFILSKKGGNGVMRELFELIIKHGG